MMKRMTIDDLARVMAKSFEAIQKEIDGINKRLDVIEERLGIVERRLDLIENVILTNMVTKKDLEDFERRLNFKWEQKFSTLL